MEVYAWGANSNAQLGVGYSSEQVGIPTRVGVEFSGDAKINAITGGAGTTLVLVEDVKYPSLYEWQHNFVIVPESSYKYIACGWDFEVLVSKQQTVLTRGSNNYGQLGNSTESRDNRCFTGINHDFSNITSFGTGLRHCACVCDGSLIVWGSNAHNQIGAHKDKKIECPRIAETNRRIIHVGCGKDFTIAVDDQGCLIGSGSNKFGVLGEYLQHVPEFQEICGFKSSCSEDLNSRIVQLSCGWGHAVAVLENGIVITWGRNDLGQLGRETVNAKYDGYPGIVNLPERIVAVATGSEHTLALSESGTVYAWGWNEHENCGVESTDKKTGCVRYPVVVRLPGKAVTIGCGAGSSFAAIQIRD